MIKILLLAANPKNTGRLRLDEEVRTIRERLRISAHGGQFTVEQEWAVRVSEIQSHLLRYQPHIVHFSGHGNRAGEIVLEDQTGASKAVPSVALKQLFATLKDNIRCVVLNACYTEIQAKAIAESIGCVVGMSTAVDDDSAVSFAASFYQALGFGRDVQTAFDLGCVQIGLESLKGQETPKLITAPGVDAKTIFLVGNKIIPAPNHQGEPPIRTAHGPSTILVAEVNSGKVSEPRLEEGVKAIEEGLEQVKARGWYKVVFERVKTDEDIINLSLKNSANILHIVNIGKAPTVILPKDESKGLMMIGRRKICIIGGEWAHIFRLLNGKLECIVLDGCFVGCPERIIEDYVEYVIVLHRKEIGNKYTNNFIINFYRNLKAGESCEKAYDSSRSSLTMRGKSEIWAPRLLMNPKVKKPGENARDGHPNNPQLEEFIRLLDLRAEAILNDFASAKEGAQKGRGEGEEVLGGDVRPISKRDVERLDLLAGRFALLHEKYKEELLNNNLFTSNEIINKIDYLIWEHRHIITPPGIYCINPYGSFMADQEDYPGLLPSAILSKLPAELEKLLFSQDDPKSNLYKYINRFGNYLL